MTQPPLLVEDTRGITAVNERGIQGVCVLDTWTKTSCQMHIWTKSPMVIRHGFFNEIFDFVFGSGRIKIIGVMASDNAKVLRFSKHLGFEELCRIKDARDVGVDMVITEFTKERYNGWKSAKTSTKSVSAVV